MLAVSGHVLSVAFVSKAAILYVDRSMGVDVQDF